MFGSPQAQEAAGRERHEIHHAIPMDNKGADTDRNGVYIWIVQPSLQLTLSINYTRVIQLLIATMGIMSQYNRCQS